MVSGQKIALILVYLGKWPIWIEAFLKSCRYNPGIDWLIFSNNTTLPQNRPENVHFIKISLNKIRDRIASRSQLPKINHPLKLCDFKVMYGHYFEEYLDSYDYWGHCDLDIIWGDIERFLTGIDFKSYDLISSRYNAISGHFTLYRNNELFKFYYQQVPGYQKIFQSAKHLGFDEGAFSYHLFNEIKGKKIDVKPFWPARNCIDNAELNRMPLGWYWKDGKIKNYLGMEGNYLHMINWKHTLKEVKISKSKNSTYFNITRFGIWEGTIPLRYIRGLLARNGLVHLLRHWKQNITNFLGHSSSESQKNEANVRDHYKILR